MTENWDLKGQVQFYMSSIVDNRKLAGKHSQQSLNAQNQTAKDRKRTCFVPEKTFDLVLKKDKTNYKLLRYWSSSEEETESDESEGEPEEGALPTQLMGFASVKIDVSQIARNWQLPR